MILVFFSPLNARCRKNMLWPIVLPFQITACVILGLIVLATALAPLAKRRRIPTLFAFSALGLLAFVPSCIGIKSVIDARRFGVFNYATFDEVNDFRVERYLPPTARNITLDKYAQGFRARYAISEAELTAYLDELWAKYGDRSSSKRGELAAMATVDREFHKLRFGDLGWPPLDDATERFSPTAENGAGFSVWFSPKEGFAYEQAGYW